jgi:hypothetical protein
MSTNDSHHQIKNHRNKHIKKSQINSSDSSSFIISSSHTSSSPSEISDALNSSARYHSIIRKSNTPKKNYGRKNASNSDSPSSTESDLKNRPHNNSRTATRSKSAEARSAQSISSEESGILELRPSATIGRPTRKGLLPNWKKIFTQSKTAKQQQESTKEKRYTQHRLVYHQATNKAIGENILNPAESSEIETIWFHNINGMKDENNWAQIITTMKENNVDIFGFAEINKSLDSFAKI